MGGALISIRSQSLSRFRVCLKLLDAALVLMIFGEVEIVIDGASVKPNVENHRAEASEAGRRSGELES